jgi:hypothetical protein
VRLGALDNLEEKEGNEMSIRAERWKMVGRSEGGWTFWLGIHRNGRLVEDDPSSMMMFKVDYVITRDVYGVPVSPVNAGVDRMDAVIRHGRVFDPSGHRFGIRPSHEPA